MKCFSSGKLNTHRERELAASQNEPENHAWLVPGLDPDQKNQTFFSNNRISQYAHSPHKRRACCINICNVQEKGLSKVTLTVGHPVG